MSVSWFDICRMIENQNGSIPVAHPTGLINASTGCGSTWWALVCVCVRVREREKVNLQF